MGGKRFTPGWEHTRDALVATLGKMLRTPGIVLEIGSGTGQQAATFAAKLPSVTWFPSEVDEALVDSIAAWRAEAALPNLRAPLSIDVRTEDWQAPPGLTALVAIDFVSAAPWPATVGLVRGAARVLPPDAELLLLGAIADDRLAEIVRLAAARGLTRIETDGLVRFRR